MAKRKSTELNSEKDVEEFLNNYVVPLEEYEERTPEEILEEAEARKKGVAYISGPMRGYPGFNYDYFDKTEDKLLSQGWLVYNPARHFEGATDKEFSEYMELDIKDVIACDTIFLLPGWQDSEGARLEVQIGKALGKDFMLVDGATATLPAELEAANLVRNGERQAAYGHPSQDFDRTAKIWSGVLGVDVSPLQVALCMVGLKMSRLVGTPDHRDSLVDAHGYFTCYERILDHEV